MNKKGVFITLTAVLIILILAFYIIENSVQTKEINKINVEYKKQKMMSDYIKDIEKLYLPSLISLSEKTAIEGISDYVNDHASAGKMDIKINLSEAVMTGNISKDYEVMDINNTLPHLITNTFNTKTGNVKFKHFDFNITTIRQLDNWTIEINSTVNFSIESETTTLYTTKNITWRNVMDYSSEISINGYTSPREQKRIIRIFWQSNNSIDCFLKTIDSSWSCGSDIHGVCPPSGCIP